MSKNNVAVGVGMVLGYTVRAVVSLAVFWLHLYILAKLDWIPF